MTGRYKRIIYLYLIVVLTLVLLPFQAMAEKTSKLESIDINKLKKIDQFVDAQLKAGDIPGMSMVIVKDKEIVYNNNFGYADKDKKVSVKGDTLFEIGTGSLSFISYGILRLENSGLINLDDNIQKYIPWFKAYYKGKEANITIKQLLYFTSGISDKIESKRVKTGRDNYMDEYVRDISGIELSNEPGKVYDYCPSSYNILRLVIEKASGKKYSQFIKDEILKPLNLNKTFLSKDDLGGLTMSEGYKISFGSLQGKMKTSDENTDVTFVSCMDDISKWLIKQISPDDAKIEQIINKSRIINSAVNVNSDGSAYGMGWKIYQSGGIIMNFGNTPYYSSFIGYRPEEKIGVAILAGINSDNVQNIGKGVLDIVNDSEPVAADDSNHKTDKTAIVVLIISCILCVLISVFFLLAIYETFTRKRRLEWDGFGSISILLMTAVFIVIFAVCIKFLPKVLFNGASWEYVYLWKPSSVTAATYSVSTAVLLFITYYLFSKFFKKPSERSYFTLIVLSTAGGLGYTLVMYIITQAIFLDMGSRNNMIFFFIMALLLYVYCQKVIRTKLILLTNNTVYEKRIELIEKIMRTPYHKIENIELSKIHNSLNHDMDVISGSLGNAITAVTSGITIVCLFIYLGIMSIFGLVFSIIFVILAFSIQTVSEKITSKIWEHSREIQNTFVSHVNNLVYGFKELSMHRKMRVDFKKDVCDISKEYRDNRCKAEHMTANSLVLAQILIYMVIGSIIFLLPVIFKEIQANTLRNYVFVFLFLVSPLVQLFDCMPKITQMKVSWKKVKDIESLLDADKYAVEEKLKELPDSDITLTVKDVEFSYDNNDWDNVFSVGPLNCEFKSGEIVFVTGGNGSGKSTLAKLITGIYCFKKGNILVNGQPIESDKLGENFSAVFSDYYLFNKLYGIDFSNKKDEIEKNLQMLQISEKLKIVDGVLSTTKLSSGQRKRLALMICYADDRPIYLFDEWAADQDPEFRKFFYNVLLPEMKAKGKCVIAITHDDRYFGVADRVIKMEMGNIIQNIDNKAV